MKNRVIKFFFAVSLLLFCVSLALPAFDTNVTYVIETRMHEPSKSYFGYQAFLFGWASVFFGCVVWLANIGYFAACFLVRNGRKLGLPVSVVAISIALSSFSHPIIEKGENGYDFYVSKLNSGFYFWLVAIALIFVAALMQSTQRKKGERS